MSARARRRRAARHCFRLLVCTTILLGTGPRATAQADIHSQGSISPSIDRKENLRRANAATVVIKAQNRARRLTSNGAGVVISSNGYILTAHHVVKGFDRISVLTVDGDLPMTAKVVLVEPAYDIALIKVETSKPLEAATFAAGQSITSGRSALVIGNPLGMGQTVRAGELGGVKTVNWDGHRAALQTVHATILKGNSGGGTFDMLTGELLGINVAKSSVSKDTGYMVTVDRLVAILNRKLPIVELADSQEIYGELGVRLRRVSLLGGKFKRGMLVTAVRPGSKAAQAGWERGDVLVGLDRYQMVDQDAVLYVLRDQSRQESSIDYMLARGDSTSKGSINMETSSALAASTTHSQANVFATVK